MLVIVSWGNVDVTASVTISVWVVEIVSYLVQRTNWSMIVVVGVEVGIVTMVLLVELEESSSR